MSSCVESKDQLGFDTKIKKKKQKKTMFSDNKLLKK